MPSTYLTRTPSSAGNRKTWTFSAWIKRTELSSSDWIIRAATGGGDAGGFYFTSDNKLAINLENSGSNVVNLHTTRLFRDISGYYHIVVRCDTTQATQADRVRLYVNGVQETSFSTTLYPSQNLDMAMCKDGAHFIATDGASSANRWSGIMSHVHLCDGYSYGADSFGSTDSNGVWKINTSPSVSYGTTGFTILKDGNTITDQSSNSNDWTLGGGTLTDMKDNPSNVFATLNALSLGSGATSANCGNSCTMDANAQFGSSSTLGMSSGKYYMEMKYSAQTGGADRIMLGVSGDPGKLRNSTPWSGGSGSGYAGGTDGYGYYSDGGNRYQNDSATAYGSSYTVNDIIGIALDLDNNRLFFSKNGTWQDSGDPTSSTGAISIAAASTTNTGCYFFAVTDTSAVYGGTIQCNFGNGYFGTTAVSSAGTNASGNGIFEYDVPTGYTALCTKGLDE